MKIDRKTLEENRREGRKVYGYKDAYCLSQIYCEECDRKVCFWCKVIRKIEKLQVKRILKICK